MVAKSYINISAMWAYLKVSTFWHLLFNNTSNRLESFVFHCLINFKTKQIQFKFISIIVLGVKTHAQYNWTLCPIFIIVHLANLAIIVRANLFYWIFTLKWRKLKFKGELAQTYPYLLYLVHSWAKESNHILCQRGSLVLGRCLQLGPSLTYIIKISLHECISASRFPSNQKSVIFSQEI